MKKSVVFLSLFSMLMATIIVNDVYANPQYAPGGGEHGHSGAMPAEAPLIGSIIQTMNGGGYTYILLKLGKKETWVAIREMEVKVGDTIALRPGIEMNNFTAKSIGQTFESIIFSDGPVSQQGASGGHGGGAPHGGVPHGGVGQQKTTPGSKGATPPSYDNINIDKAAGPNAYTVVELYEKRTELSKKDIVLKGQVVKVSQQIMGKNWLHVQDGTGYQQNGTNDIVVTTNDLPSVGDVVTIKGILYENKDFGSGYKYDVIIEQAEVTK